jgi:hypothetical protein
MYKIADIFRQYAPAYIEQFGNRIPLEHRKVIEAIVNCRTPDAGVAVYGCNNCPNKKLVYLGCGNRHCPNCQQDSRGNAETAGSGRRSEASTHKNG